MWIFGDYHCLDFGLFFQTQFSFFNLQFLTEFVFIIQKFPKLNFTHSADTMEINYMLWIVLWKSVTTSKFSATTNVHSNEWYFVPRKGYDRG